MVESSRIFKFLAGLNVEFDEVRGRIIGRQPLPSIGEVFSEVRWRRVGEVLCWEKELQPVHLRTLP